MPHLISTTDSINYDNGANMKSYTEGDPHADATEKSCVDTNYFTHPELTWDKDLDTNDCILNELTGERDVDTSYDIHDELAGSSGTCSKHEVRNQLTRESGIDTKYETRDKANMGSIAYTNNGTNVENGVHTQRDTQCEMTGERGVCKKLNTCNDVTVKRDEHTKCAPRIAMGSGVDIKLDAHNAAIIVQSDVDATLYPHDGVTAKGSNHTKCDAVNEVTACTSVHAVSTSQYTITVNTSATTNCSTYSAVNAQSGVDAKIGTHKKEYEDFKVDTKLDTYNEVSANSEAYGRLSAYSKVTADTCFDVWTTNTGSKPESFRDSQLSTCVGLKAQASPYNETRTYIGEDEDKKSIKLECTVDDPEPSHDNEKIADVSPVTRRDPSVLKSIFRFTVDEQHQTGFKLVLPETENKVSQNCKTTKQFQSCLVQDNRKCKVRNCDLVAEIKTAVRDRHTRTSKKFERDHSQEDNRAKSADTAVTGSDNTRENDMMKGDGWVEERLIIHFPAKRQQAVFERESGLQPYPGQSFRNLQKLGDNFDRIATSLSAKVADFFDNVYSKETSVQLLRRARNEALLPAGTFDVQTVAPSTLYDPIAFFSSLLERLRWEFWRLCTFAPLSDSLPVSPIRLAQSGFSFDEEQDDIICFSCGLRKRHWSEKEKAVAVVHLALNENCPHANFADDTNVPIETDTPRLSSTPGTGQPQSEVFHRERRDDSIRTDYEVPDGLQSSKSSESAFSRYQYHFNGVITANHTPTPASQRSSQNGHTAAISGGNEQNGQVQAYSLPPPISRAEEISSHRQLAALSAGTALQQTVVSSCPSASYTQITQSQATNVPAAAAEAAAGHSQYPVQPEQAPEAVPPETLRYGSQGNSEDHSALESDGDHSEASGLDIRRAACPENSSAKGRLASFGDWPGAGLPTPRDLVPAGFYYMGTGDSVRCFYCGVTLRNWREHDDPWLTHVRFRFSCAYVTAIKGENFVLQALMKHANGQPVTGEAEQTER